MDADDHQRQAHERRTVPDRRPRAHSPAQTAAADWIVTALTEGRGFDWESRAPGVQVLARHAVEPAAGGSRVTLSVQYSGFLGGILGRLIAGINRRYIALEADGLKRRAEAQAAGA